jgi:hypothetical protein
MQLNIENLKTIGAFTGAPVEKEIKWKQGEEEHTATVFIRPLSYKSTVSDLQAVNDKKDPVATRIACSVCDSSGVPIFTTDDITGDADPERGALDGNLAMSLLAAIAEVNYLGKPTS